MKSEQVREKQRAYWRKYYAKNRDKINARRRKPPREDCWKRTGFRTRASWAELGLDEERRKELAGIAQDDEYSDVVLKAALKTDRLAAGHIALSATRSLSYERIEFDERIGRCPISRTSFYAEKRLFFHYFDQMLKEQEGRGRLEQAATGRNPLELC